MATYPESLDGMMPPPKKKGGVWRFIGRHLPSAAVVLMALALILVVLWPYVVVTVPSGRVGVLWRRFYAFDFYCLCFVGRGTALDPRELREEGLHIIWPWDHLFLYDLRLQSTTQTYNAISKDGVSVSAQINVRFQLLHNSVAVLHKFIGPGYLASVVGPEIGSQAREVISEYTAQEVYTSREAIQEKIRDSSQKRLGSNLNKLVQPEAMEELDPKHYNDFLQNSIQILDTLVLSIELPEEIVSAINRQTEQFYMIQEYRFRVAREAEESKRKQIEANGIASFQKTVSQGISDSYLRWRGIEATLQLAQSPNSKIVVIGTGKDGLPIILGNVDSPASSGASPTPGANGTTPSPQPSRAPPFKPPGAPSANKPGATPPDTGSTEAAPARKSSSDDTRPALNKVPTADSSAAPGSADKPRDSSSPVDLSEIEAMLSRISGALRLTPLPPASETPPPPKQ